MKIINNGYHELYIDREKQILSRVLRDWMKEKLERVKNVGGVKVHVGWCCHLRPARSSSKGKIILLVGMYLLVMFA